MRTHGRRRGRLLAAAAVAGAACAAMLSLSGTGPADAATATPAARTTPAAPAPAALWGPVSRLPGTPALGGDDEPTALACYGVGDCVAVGAGVQPNYYLPAPASLATETHGVWGKAVPFPGLAAIASADKAVSFQVGPVSCGAPGDCVAGGWYTTAGDERGNAFLASEANGVWSDANVPGLAALATGGASAVSQLSCTAPGDCTAGGDYQITPYQSSPWETAGYVINETNGHWGSPVPLPGIAIVPNSVAQLTELSCASPGNCAAAGNIHIQTGPIGNNTQTYEAFVLQETGGRWQQARMIPGMTEITRLACPAAGDCTGAGVAGPLSADCPGDIYGSCPAAVLTEKNGSWGTPHQVVTAAQARTTQSSVNALSCASAGNCVAAGFIGAQTMVLQEKNGAWSAPGQLPGVPAVKGGGGSAVTSLACPAAGDCDAGGYYDTAADGKQLGFVATEAGGRWGRPQLTSSGGIGLITCFSASSCVGLVNSWNNPGYYQFVMEKEPVQATRTTLSLSVARVTYGHEQSLRISVAVSAGIGLPFGTVLVDAGAAAVHPILLGSGAGSYTLGSRQLKPGTYHLVARYVGDPYFQRSTSAQRTLTVVK
jgi:Bacterial Ig-like domain (group 3)